MENKCPPLSPALLNHLQEAFPDRTVDPSKKDPAVAFGNAEVIRYLQSEYEQQQEDPDVSI